MQLKVFAVTAQGGEEAVEEMNKFLRSHRVLSIERRLVEQGGAYWSFCVEYLERGGEGSGPRHCGPGILPGAILSCSVGLCPSHFFPRSGSFPIQSATVIDRRYSSFPHVRHHAL
jgi:hypothetical protein